MLQALRGAGWVVPADQQDAHELLHVLLSCVEEETAAMAKKVYNFYFHFSFVHMVIVIQSVC